MGRNLAARLLAWFDRHGRHDLPWQRPRTPYRVWVSEVMLQQTQVATVIPYFERFLARFPDIPALAAAPLEEVLGQWSGLGYYGRARNLHQAAGGIMENHDGRFPETLDEVMALPGVGRSTAGAVLALAKGQRHPILDGNVKRVLCRYHAIEGWPESALVQKRLWALAEEHTPKVRVADYTQAIMDLGATLCSRTRPNCPACPLMSDCRACAEGDPSRYPTPKPRKSIPTRHATFLLLLNPVGEVLLERRPPSGIWGGLWSLPECPEGEEPRTWCAERLGIMTAAPEPLPPLRHTFSHFHLEIQPLQLRAATPNSVAEAPHRWHPPEAWDALGLPAPVRRLLEQLES